MKGPTVVLTLIIVIIIIIITCYFHICDCERKNGIRILKHISKPKDVIRTHFFLKPITITNNKYSIKLVTRKKEIKWKINGRRKKEKENVEQVLNNSREETFLIVDGSSVLFKNFFGMPFLKTNDDVNISTIYGFIQSLNKIYKLFSPKYILIVFDAKSSNNEKKKLYAKYKILRKKNPDEIYEQLKIINNFCDIIGIKTFVSEDVESDNYIAEVVGKIYNTIKRENENYRNEGVTNTSEIINMGLQIEDKNKQKDLEENKGKKEKKKEEEKEDEDEAVEYGEGERQYKEVGQKEVGQKEVGQKEVGQKEVGLKEVGQKEVEQKERGEECRSFRVVIVSSDKDLLQLLEYDEQLKNLKVRICQPNKKYKVFDTQTFIEEYELMPNQYCDFLVMAGDKTDCISGIPQIGDKISKCLLKQYKSIENILKNIHQLPEKFYNMFINNLENIKIFKKLIQLKCETTQYLMLDDYRQGHIKDFDMYQNFLDKYALHKLMQKSIIIEHKGGL